MVEGSSGLGQAGDFRHFFIAAAGARDYIHPLHTGRLSAGPSGPARGVPKVLFEGGSTMKAACKALLAVAMVFTLVGMTRAADKPAKKTLKGEIVCTKCKLKETEKCGNAIVVKEGDKEVTYYFIDKGRGEKYHKNFCTGAKEGTVTGVVSTKGGKHYIKPDKDGVKFD